VYVKMFRTFYSGCREYSINFRILGYSLHNLRSISGCKFPFQVAVFLQSVDRSLEFMEAEGLK